MVNLAQRLMQTLAVLSLATLAACAAIQPMARCKPTKPVLATVQTVDGGICLDREDTRQLMHYIVDLERCAP